MFQRFLKTTAIQNKMSKRVNIGRADSLVQCKSTLLLGLYQSNAELDFVCFVSVGSINSIDVDVVFTENSPFVTVDLILFGHIRRCFCHCILH